MRAVTLHRGELRVEQVPTPEPGRGQLLLRVLRAGICGSDLHARLHADASADIAAEVGYHHFMRTDQSVILGHEFVGEVVAYGPGCRARWKPGTRVVSLPLIKQDDGIQMTGLSERAPGAYAEYVLAAEDATMEVPAELTDDLAALTEPLAVAHHAIRRGRVSRKDVAIVIGCGPIGLAVILMLKSAGVRTVVASDPADARRTLAAQCGADIVVDPAEGSPWTVAADGHIMTAPALYGAGIDALHTLRAVRGTPWTTIMKAAKRAGIGPRGPVVFECVGLPGIIEQIVTNAPFLARIIVVGVCMTPDSFRPTMAVNKEVDLRFSFCYDPAEFHDTLHMIGRGKIDPTPMVTGVVSLDGVADAFEQLIRTTHHAKVLIDPNLA
ncbi:Threonine dehydrogenase [Parafrankia irregularis]|uniref:Threonine dehydrogenase n=1 Tax=Parafrankia irregularis TaxID=795642 RepID=A0A0S4QX53_9ACTN|nr:MULTISPECIES: zinc-binding dehydrogenase [Parafrankia]MBE3200320.1 zinc-binding dehydrogenase [Parafrankia sp. CH37]CUU59727.1 Threonine dehydrogenase [Parafrankia irregularis]